MGCYEAGDVDDVRSSIFFTEEFVGHYSFKKLVTEQMRNPEKRMYNTRDSLRWLSQLAEALEYLHSQDPAYTHGDVKCDNVFMNDGLLSKVGIKLADLKPHRRIFERAVHAARPKLRQGQSTLARYSACSARRSLDSSGRGDKQQQGQQHRDGKEEERGAGTSGSGGKAASSGAEGLRGSIRLPDAVRQKLSNLSVTMHSSSSTAASSASSAAPAVPATATAPVPAQPGAFGLHVSASAPASDSVLAGASASARSEASKGADLMSLSVPSYGSTEQQQQQQQQQQQPAAGGSSGSGSAPPLDGKPPAGPRPPAPRPKGALSSAFAAAAEAAAAANGGAPPGASQSIAIPRAQPLISEPVAIPSKSRQQVASSSFCADMLLGSQEDLPLEDLPVR
jgi:hypothetical protein